MQDCREQSQIPLAECLCLCAVGICATEAEEVDICLQMVSRYTFQFSVADRVLLDTVYCTLICHNRTVTQIAGLQFFFHPHIQQRSHRNIFGLRYEFLFLVVLHCLSEQCFCFRLAFCSGELLLHTVSAFIFDIKAVVPLFAFLSYRTFCHR